MRNIFFPHYLSGEPNNYVYLYARCIITGAWLVL